MDLKIRTVLTAQQWQELQRRQRSWPDLRAGAAEVLAPDGAPTYESEPINEYVFEQAFPPIIDFVPGTVSVE